MYNQTLGKNRQLTAISEDKNVFRYAAVIEYVGTDFDGSQIQPGRRTVQGELENALRVLIKDDIKVYFSGRTDRGVHSRGQVVHFDVNQKLNEYVFTNSLNALLPPDMSVSALSLVDNLFHAQRCAKFKFYRYRINNSKQRSVWMDNALLIRDELDVEAMNLALSYIKGKHDFSSFKKSNTQNPAKECVVYSAECKKVGCIINVDIVADRFLYNMMRIIVGTLIEIGRGVKPAVWMKELLDQKDRTKAAHTVSAEGLTLMYVGYKKEYNDNLNKEATKDENLFCKAS